MDIYKYVYTHILSVLQCRYCEIPAFSKDGYVDDFLWKWHPDISWFDAQYYTDKNYNYSMPVKCIESMKILSLLSYDTGHQKLSIYYSHS